MKQDEYSGEEEFDEYLEVEEQFVDMLHDLSASQAGIISKLEELSEVDSGRNAEFKASLAKVLDEVRANSEAVSFSLAEEEEKDSKSFQGLNLNLGLAFLVLITVITLAIYSLTNLINLNKQWETKLKEKMHEAIQLDKVIDLFEKQKEKKSATGQFN